MGLALIYLIFGSTWILLSDKFLLFVFQDLTPKQLTSLQTYKGWFYVFTTSLLLFLIVKFYLSAVNQGKEKLKESENKYRILFEMNPSPVWVCSKSSLKVLTANDAFIKKYGYSFAEISSLNLTSLFTEQESKKVLLLLDDSNPNFSGVWSHLEKNGNHIFVELYNHNFIFGNEEAIMFLAFDITGRILIENEIRLLNKELEKRVEDRTEELKETIEELKAFTYSVSHDLRTPLRAINNFTSRFIEQNKSHFDEKGEKQLEIILKSSVEMNNLIEALLNLSNISRQEINTTRIPMNLLIDSVIENLCTNHKCKKEIFHFDKLEDIYGDSSLIQIVFTNFLSNAVKFTGKKDKPLIKITSQNHEGLIIFCVEDNGVGFEKEYSHKLFNVFQRLHTKEEFEGTGIGLAIVKRIILKHGGKVWAESEPGLWTRFYFSIPKI